ncbi:MAG: DUF4339 domain-containing protein [Planctomycetes bacterium]|nr:DUF4339 domain-containing protein [Planctomycetota bacterium]
MSATLVSLTDEKSFPLNRPSIFVGRDRWRVDVRLSGDDVDEVHCELVQQGSGFRLINLSSSGTLVNGEPVSEVVLHDGDEVTIATHRLRLSCAETSKARVDVWSDAAAEAEWAALNQFDDVETSPAVELKPHTSISASVPELGASEPKAARQLIESPESHRWKIQLAGMELGPMSWDELQQMVQTGQAQPADPVRAEGTEDWCPYSEVIAGPRPAAKQNPPQPASAPSLLPSGENVADGRMKGRHNRPSIPASKIDEGPITEAHSEEEPPVELPPVEPQYFVILDESDSPTETGPVPLEALQQLALEYRLNGVTRVRREDETDWSAAGALAIDFPPPLETEAESPKKQTKVRPETATPPPSRNLVTGVVWLILAPIYTLADAIRGLLSMPKKTIVVTAVVAVAVSFLLFTWIRGWSQTALTGTLTLDGEPVPAVVITLTGMMTGDSAVGITDSSGRFSAITLDGELVPGNYHVTVVKSDSGSQQGEDALVRIPMKYQSIGTTDVIIEVKEGESNYDVPLSAKISGTLVDEGR